VSPDLDLRWLERAGYTVDVAEVEPGIYAVTLTHVKNRAMRYVNVARGASEHLAIAHAREQLEEALAERPRRGRHDLTPITIVATRYSGGYEGGVWAALPVHPREVPEPATGDDPDCQTWWERPPFAVGLGATPDRALAALDDAIDRCEHPEQLQFEVPAGLVCEYCKQLRRQ
jgi:hypothetical protein